MTTANQARFDALDRELDAQNNPPPAPEPAQIGAAQDQGGALAIPLPDMLTGLFASAAAGGAQFFPSLAAALPDDKCRALGDAIAPVLVKYGLDRHFTGAPSVELGALFVVLPIGFGVYQAIRQDLDAAKLAAQAQRNGQPSPVPGASPAPAPVAPANGLKQPNP